MNTLVSLPFFFWLGISLLASGETVTANEQLAASYEELRCAGQGGQSSHCRGEEPPRNGKVLVAVSGQVSPVFRQKLGEHDTELIDLLSPGPLKVIVAYWSSRSECKKEQFRNCGVQSPDCGMN